LVKLMRDKVCAFSLQPLGALRFLTQAPELAGLPAPDVAFNFLGRAPMPEGQPWAPIAGRSEEAFAGAAELFHAHPVEINAVIRDTECGPELLADMSFSGVANADADELAQLWRGAICGLAQLPPPSSPPLSFSQLDIMHQPVPAEDPHHNVIVASLLRGRLDTGALATALTALADRHAALRTRIAGPPGRWRQTVDPVGRWPLQITTPPAGAEHEMLEAVRAAVSAQEVAPFSLSDGPLARAEAVVLGPDRHALILVLHHIVIDPWSFAILGRELAELYDAALRGRRPVLGEVSVDYLQHSLTQQRMLSSGELAAAERHWRRLLAGVRSLPTFAIREGANREPDGDTLGFSLPPELTKALHQMARAQGVTLFTVLLAAFHTAIAAHSDTAAPPVSFPLAGRPRAESEEVVGFCISPVAIAPEFDTAGSFRQLLSAIGAAFLEAHAHQEFPLRAIDGGIDEARNPLRLLFNLVNTGADGLLRLPGLQASPVPLSAGDDAVIPELATKMRPENVDLYLIMRETGETLSGLWLFSRTAVPACTMAAISASWETLLRIITADPDIALPRLRALVASPVSPSPTQEPS
jgi:hypothetical protein